MTDPVAMLKVETFDDRVGSLHAAARIRTLQINIRLVCNLACRHCHVESGPKRLSERDNMSAQVAEHVLDWLAKNPEIETVDITGGSPELNPNFRRIVETARALGRHVIDRCNPTIIRYVDPRTGQDGTWIPDFLAENQVEVVASMPCYLEDNVDHQRGRGSYASSVEGLRRLNDVGYGLDPDLRLNLVHNPNGAVLPPPEADLVEDYKRELADHFGIVFNDLWTIRDPILSSFRDDYSDFDNWFAKCQQQHRVTWIIMGEGDTLAALTIVKEESTVRNLASGKVLKICSFKVSEDCNRCRCGPIRRIVGLPATPSTRPAAP